MKSFKNILQGIHPYRGNGNNISIFTANIKNLGETKSNRTAASVSWSFILFTAQKQV
jgi:hypothetical protein